MIACPAHGTMLVSSCHECDEPLSWLRTDLLECSCGASLKAIEGISINQSAKDILDVVRRKVLGLPIPDKYPSRIPASDLREMKLRSLLYLIELLGKRSSAGTLSIRERSKILFRASEALSDWPRNFFRMLEEFREDKWEESGASLRDGPLNLIRGALMYGVRHKKDALFVRAALSQFAKSHRGKRVWNASVKKADQLVPDRCVSRSDFARRLGIGLKMLDYLIEGNVVDVLITKRGDVYVDPISIEGEWVYSAPEAARALSIPLPLFIELKRSGFFSTSHLPVGSRRHHDVDLTEFCRILESRLLPRKSGKGELIRFGNAIRNAFYTAEMKVEIVRRILEGEIPVFGETTTPLGQLKVERRLLISLMPTENMRSTSARSTINGATRGYFPMIATDAASVLGCDPEAIARLVAEKHLKATRKGRVLWVDGRSVHRFQKGYVRISSVAKELDCSALRLIDICLKSQIPMIVCDVAGKYKRNAFISCKHQAKLSEQYFRYKNKRGNKIGGGSST